MTKEEFERRFERFTRRLTKVEREAFRLLVEGKSRKEIADTVFVCDKAISARMRVAYQKLGLLGPVDNTPRKSIQAIVLFYKYCLDLDQPKLGEPGFVLPEGRDK